MAQNAASELAAVGVSDAPRRTEGSYMPCFLAGVMAARVTAAAMRLPLFTFAHQQGHIAAALFGAGRLDLLHQRFVAFHLSGGTTECVLVEELPAGKLTLLSATNDLNAGQVVDRVGRMLGLPFPAGPALDALARQSDARARIRPSFRNGNPCLSGVENQCSAMLMRGEAPCDIARFCIDSISASLLQMAQNAISETGCDTLLFAGGVMSNSIIRPELERRLGGIFAPSTFSCDNAAGIAVLAADAARMLLD
ncbi:MAG: peptidase M22, partial [Oscillospiraceae bacterium]